ncbi:hypothetical protein GN956_G24317 [Arapaima gigas]
MVRQVKLSVPARDPAAQRPLLLPSVQEPLQDTAPPEQAEEVGLGGGACSLNTSMNNSLLPELLPVDPSRTFTQHVYSA